MSARSEPRSDVETFPNPNPGRGSGLTGMGAAASTAGLATGFGFAGSLAASTLGRATTTAGALRLAAGLPAASGRRGAGFFALAIRAAGFFAGMSYSSGPVSSRLL